MFLDAVRHIRDPNIRRTLALAAWLMCGAVPLTGCPPNPPNPITCGSACDPDVQLREPEFHAGATVSVRTPAAGDNGVTLFARTGVLAPIDNPSAAAVPAIAGVTTGGTAGLRQSITVPLYGGVTVPAKNLGVPIANLSFEAFVGANIKSQKTGFAVDEMFGGGVVSASQTYWGVNPAVGGGIQYYLGTFYGVPTSLGAAYIVDIQTRDEVLNVASQNIPGVVYTDIHPAHVSGTAAFTVNFDLPPK
jgi:hypothetical protein